VHTEAIEVFTGISFVVGLSLACGLQQLSPSRVTSAKNKSSATFLNDVDSYRALKYG